ncbi:hypothetical protein FDT66_07455 [Polaribacter aestuariivivens]|uniref:Alpha-L-arabinofuranosidase n=1 Tax=Polaribacter aestuariivivens TaxID=2304626 RepID=A0A5S3N6L3_9FLAO|nr:hypothetical protein [Polaribacter aestuariivivens]TMM30592.1 hypothetical protein FDT66_07455 [Polaribacter aestuariivivens]
MNILFFSCSSSETQVPEEDDRGDVIISPEIILTVNTNDGIDINPEIFGVNNDWRQITNVGFSNFSNTLKSINSTLIRYPGGWESEYYNWDTNSTPNWNNKPNVPGASIQTLKNNSSNYSIVIPTADAMNEEIGSSKFNIAIENLKTTAEKAITKSNIKDGIVEIGNEWWLQYAGGVTRLEKLNKYTNIAMNLAEFIAENFPNRTFKLLVNGDYTQPNEFTLMKSKFTKAYNQIDGIALHTYVGYQSTTHSMANLEQRIKECANNFNPQKNFIYLSEWMPSRDYNERALYMQAANIIPDIIQIYARSGANAAAYWSPINSSIPGLGLTNWNYSLVYPVGQIFGELAESYKGKSLKTTSNKFHISASLNDNETVVLFITGGNQPFAKVGVVLEGFEIGSIESVKRFLPSNYSETNRAEPYVEEISEAVINKNNQVVVAINKECKYQIYKLVLKRK